MKIHFFLHHFIEKILFLGDVRKKKVVIYALDNPISKNRSRYTGLPYYVSV